MAARTVHTSNSGEDFNAVVDVLNQVSTAVAEIQTNFASLLAALDADPDITATDWTTDHELEEEAPDTVVLGY